MGLFSFISTAGEKLFGGSQIDENAVREHILSLGLQLSALSVVAFHAEKKVALIGRAATMEAKEKAILAAGNVKGVEQVEDRLKRVPVADESASMTAASPAVVAQADTDEVAESDSAELPTANFYPVKAGDTLSAIAKREYGSASSYPKIFEANRPMLADSDTIYPGQVLRIPPL